MTTRTVRAKPSPSPMRRGRLPTSSCRHDHVDGLERQSGRNASPSGVTPSTIMSPTRPTAGSRTEIRLGARAHTPPIAPARRLSSAPRSALPAAQRGDRAPPLTLNQQPDVDGLATATPVNTNPDRALDTRSLHR
jgi:hypothetical protein